MAQDHHNHTHERVPSPMPAVNEYEAAFLRRGNTFMAEAVADVIRYVKIATEDEIKKRENDNKNV